MQEGSHREIPLCQHRGLPPFVQEDGTLLPKKALNVSSFKVVDEIVKCLCTYSSSLLAQSCLNDRTSGEGEGGAWLTQSVKHGTLDLCLCQEPLFGVI